MPQTGYTPLFIYSSTTAAATPTAGNLNNGTLGSELAVNITDGKLFYKDNANAVQVLAWKITPTTAGGTGLTSYTAGDLVYYATGTTLSKLGIGTAYYQLGVNAGATAPVYQPSATSVLTTQGDLLYASAANTLARLPKDATATRYLSNTGTTNNPAWAQINLTNGVTGTLPVTNGGTGTATAFTAGSVVFAGASGVYTQDNSYFYYDLSNTRLGLGTNSPARRLELAGLTNGPPLRITNTNGNTGIEMLTATTKYSWLLAAQYNVGDAFEITASTAVGGTTFSTPLVTVTAPGGDVAVKTGNIIPSTAGKGVLFNANTPAAGMTSQLLNWYEEGTWTPVITGWTVVGAATLTGKYTRIGRLVTFHAFISHATSTQSVAGTSYIKNLPFTPAADSSCIASSNATDVGYGTGSVSGSNTTDQIYPPSVTLGANQVLTVTGTYYV